MVQIFGLIVLKWKNLHESKHPIILSGHIEGNSWLTWFYKNQYLLDYFLIF